MVIMSRKHGIVLSIAAIMVIALTACPNPDNARIQSWIIAFPPQTVPHFLGNDFYTTVTGYMTDKQRKEVSPKLTSALNTAATTEATRCETLFQGKTNIDLIYSGFQYYKVDNANIINLNFDFVMSANAQTLSQKLNAAITAAAGSSFPQQE
jgi:hypothetical protein